MSKLYHGTSESAARDALQHGLLPRSSTFKASNWPKAASHSDLVYLTTAYAPYFAAQASSVGRMAIIEVETSGLDDEQFRPDEDFLEQASRDQHVKGCKARTMMGRTRWFRDNVDQFSHMWQASLQYMGVASYRGIVPASAITRVAFFDSMTNQYVASMCIDPSISILNYRFVGQKYVQLTRWFFGDDFDLATLLFGIPIDLSELGEIAENGKRHLDIVTGLEVTKC